MILTSKTRYAVMAIIEIAANSSNNNPAKPIALSEIAKNQNISLSYLEQIFSKLKKSRLVTSVKGPGGGYILNKNSEELKIAQIIKAMGEPIKMTNCGNKTLGCEKNKNTKCKTHHLWKGLEENIYNYLNSVSLEDVCH